MGSFKCCYFILLELLSIANYYTLYNLGRHNYTRLTNNTYQNDNNTYQTYQTMVNDIELNQSLKSFFEKL